MADGNGTNGNGSKFSERIADNVWAKIAARYILPAVVALIGGMGTLILNQLKDGQVQAAAALSAVNNQIVRIGDRQSEALTAIKVLATEVRANRERSDYADEQIGRAIDQFRSRIDRMEIRP